MLKIEIKKNNKKTKQNRPEFTFQTCDLNNEIEITSYKKK